MIIKLVDPKIVYGFLQEENRGQELLKFIEANGGNSIPPVPVFRIPDEIRERYEYTFIGDGNCRRNIAEHLNHLLPIAIYEEKEEINPEKNGLAFSRHLLNPNRYKIAMHIYSR